MADAAPLEPVSAPSAPIEAELVLELRQALRNAETRRLAQVADLNMRIHVLETALLEAVAPAHRSAPSGKPDA